MSTTENSNAIDEKKAQEEGTTTTSPDFKGFITNYFSSIVFTIGITIFIIGGLGLYTTKVAQANILPDNIELAPYTIFDRIVDDNKYYIDINVMRPSFFSDNKETFSQKANFNSQEYLDSFNKSILCSLKKSADPNAGLFANAPLYFSFVYDNLVAKNFLAINTIFFYLSYLPESIIMLLYGIFGIFLWMGLYFFNVCISIFYHIINIPQLFRTVSKQNDKKWEPMESISFIRFMKLILFFFLWIPIGTLSAFITPAFFTLYGLISPLFAKYNIKGGKSNNNISNFLYDNLVYKKFFFFILATVSLFTNGIKYLGNNAIVGVIVAVIFAYFMGLYTNEMPEVGIDGFTSKIRQHMRQCNVFDINNNNPKLVKICERIPVNDEKIENIIAQGRMRELKKPTKVGGDYDYENDDGEEENHIAQKAVDTNIHVDEQPSATPILFDGQSSTSVTSSQPSSKTTLSQIDILRNKLAELNKKQRELPSPAGFKEVMDHTRDTEEINRQIDDINKQINILEGQSGGRKHKKLNNKKFNIRWS